ncbi:flagellar protein FliS [Parerythrobacter jejuensis]|uniref:Flagellin n=1 Tax=Parerythrobacter jejuensis TaxID=795812 RepID=A0A845AY18_9SPHN|nr:flagellar protein FliS [Parerythrobacter jejuensis]MXP30626.1 hypothetical protein [Parerythrobacter jejuensis]MXP33386.1 hypothetical protein [Parerythrobacter jejuensis]
MMFQSPDPTEAYRKIEFDARIEGSNGIGLTRLCLERALTELDRAQSAYARGNRQAWGTALTRAASGITALSAGVDSANPLREPLVHLYDSAALAVRAAVTNYRQDVMDRVRRDLEDILAIL